MTPSPTTAVQAQEPPAGSRLVGSADTAWAMSQENVEIVRRTLDNFYAFMRGELSREALAELVDPQSELHWRDQQTYPDTPQHLRGVPELIEFGEQYRRTWADLATELLELIDAPGDRVLALIRQSGRGVRAASRWKSTSS